MASSSNTKGSNPAPDFALFMNRIQVSLDSGSRSADFIQQYKKQAAAKLSSTNSTTTPNQQAPTAGGAFSSFQSSKPATVSNKARSHETDRTARLAAEEAEFADDRSADPNAGIGFARPKGAGLLPATQRERDTQKLRGRLLGGRNKNNTGSRDDHAAGDARRRLAIRGRGAESSDDEPGRSGLGRAKKVAKRSREADSSDEGGLGGEVRSGERDSEELDTSSIASPATQVAVSDASAAHSGQSLPLESAPSAKHALQSSESKSKRKKKKKKTKKTSAL